MLSELYRIPGPWRGTLTMSARPRGDDWLEDEIRDWHAAGVRSVVSLLTPEETADLGLMREPEICEANRVAFHRLPIVDRAIPPSDGRTQKAIDGIREELERGISVNIHCRQGIGRSALIAAALLIEKGVLPDEAIERIAKARGVPVPETREQRAWIDQFATSMRH